MPLTIAASVPIAPVFSAEQPRSQKASCWGPVMGLSDTFPSEGALGSGVTVAASLHCRLLLGFSYLSHRLCSPTSEVGPLDCCSHDWATPRSTFWGILSLRVCPSLTALLPVWSQGHRDFRGGYVWGLLQGFSCLGRGVDCRAITKASRFPGGPADSQVRTQLTGRVLWWGLGMLVWIA